jgi:hypothetical protein
MQRSAILLTLLVSGSVANPSALAAPESLPIHVRDFLSEHCVDCHDRAEQKGKVMLDFDKIDFSSPTSARLLEQVHRVLEKGEMPPKKKARPPHTQSQSLLAWLDTTLTSKVPPHTVTLRRLNRTEYANTLLNVFGFPYVIPPGFPADTESHGFSNVAEALAVSPPLLDAYSEAATSIADQVFPQPAPPPPPSETVIIPPSQLSRSAAYGPSSLVVDNRMRLALRGVFSETSSFGAKVSGRYRVRFKASAFKPETEEPLILKVTNKEFTIPTEGVVEHELMVTLHPGQGVSFSYANSPNRSVDANAPHDNFREDTLARMKKHPRLLAAWLPLHEPVPGDPNGAIKLKTFEAKGFELLKKAVADAYHAEFEKPDLDLSTATEENARRVIDAMLVDKNPTSFGGLALHHYIVPWVWKYYSEGPGLDIHSVEIEGPIETVENPRYGKARGLQTRLFGMTASKMDPAKHLPGALHKMLSKLFRRPPTPEEAERYMALVRDHQSEGHSLEDALHLAIRTAMVAPQFLYRGGTEATLSPYDLASRLAYFLTLRPPDDALLAAAADGSLSQPATLRAQAERLLGEKTSQDFVESFVRQWLNTRLIPEIMPDPTLGPFTPNTQKALMLEPELLFAELLRENRPISDLIDPDFLHTHSSVGRQMYGLLEMPLSSVKTPFAMSRISIPRGGRNGGILGQAGVMMATANGVDTQPVLRGKWVLENVLGDPPPPPPESVPAITPDTRGSKTIRDLMAAHTQEESCARCHLKIDPLGFALENFDAIGQWRETYPVAGSKKQKNGPPVDASGLLPDGTPIRGVVDLKKYILSDLKPFSRCLTEKLFIYSTGRVPDYAERKQLHVVADNAAKQNAGLRDLLLQLVSSECFRNL